MEHFTLTGKIILNRYLVGTCIGYGSFGDVYLVYDTQSEQIFAMKSQTQKTKNPQLANQAKIMKQLIGQRGFVSYHFYGYESKFNFIVMGLLGPSLQDLFNICKRSFSLKTILMIAEQIITRLQTFHSKNYIYRDIKAQNFLMGLHEHSHIVHLVDYGLSKKYRDKKTHQHVTYKQSRSMVGTVRYCSINMHLGIQSSRRDDLQSVGYLLQYFYKGTLPWQGVVANSTLQKYSKILQLKQTICIEQQFMDMPIQFSTYMHYVRSLKFSERPDYSFLRKLFTDLMAKLGYKNDYVFDWCQLRHSAKLETNTMHLTIKNKFCNLQNPYVTMKTGQQYDNLVFQEQINLKVDSDIKDQVKQQQPVRIETQVQLQVDQNEGNIDPTILQDSNLKLISNRNKWFDSQL